MSTIDFVTRFAAGRMSRRLAGCLIISAALVSCGQRTEYVNLDTTIPPELLRQNTVAPRPAPRLQDVVLILVDYREALERSNGQLAAIACIVDPRDERCTAKTPK